MTTSILPDVERILVLRTEIILLMLTRFLDKKGYVNIKEEGCDSAGEFRFRDGNFTWKVGRGNSVQEIYFVLEYTEDFKKPQGMIPIYHSLRESAPEARYAFHVDDALRILVKGLVARYPDIKQQVKDLFSAIPE